MKYQNIIFDLYGTLVDIHTDETSPALWLAMAAYYAQAGASYQPEELKNAYFQSIASAERGKSVLRQDAHEAHPEIQIELVFQLLFQAKGISASPEEAVRAAQEFRRQSTEYIRLYDGAKELLCGLRERGCGIWLLSNAQRVFTALELDELGLTPLFDGVYLSSDYGVKKPDRCFFDCLLKDRGISPDQAIMIGNDGICDIQGARSAGLAAFYIRSNISPQEPLPAADYVLESMDLKRVLSVLTESKPVACERRNVR